jgi:hypothetical protein
MNNAQKIHQLSLFALISALAVGGVAVASYIQGSNPSFVAGTPSAKSLVFSDGTDTAIPLVLKKNVGEIRGGMMTAAVSTDSGTIQLGAERKKGPGVFDCILVWDANAINSTVTFFVSAVNITSVAVLAETSSYTDNTHCTLAFIGYPNSLSFTEGAAVTEASLTGSLGTPTAYSSTVTPGSGNTSLVTASGFSNVKTIAFKVTAKQIGNTAHFQPFTVNWAC